MSGRLGLLQAVPGIVVANIPGGFVEEPGQHRRIATWVVRAERGIRTHDRRTAPIVAVCVGTAIVVNTPFGMGIVGHRGDRRRT